MVHLLTLSNQQKNKFPGTLTMTAEKKSLKTTHLCVAYAKTDFAHLVEINLHFRAFKFWDGFIWCYFLYNSLPEKTVWNSAILLNMIKNVCGNIAF